jgi:hypothetical protein
MTLETFAAQSCQTERTQPPLAGNDPLTHPPDGFNHPVACDLHRQGRLSDNR